MALQSKSEDFTGVSLMTDLSTQGENIWNNLLTEVAAKAKNGLQGASVIVLGDFGSGKASLVSSLEHLQSFCKGSMFEYHCLCFKPEITDTYTYSFGATPVVYGLMDKLVLPIWVMKNQEVSSSFLYHALPSASPSKAITLITISLDHQNPISSLQHWAAVLTQSVNSQYSSDVINEAKEFQKNFWRDYCESSGCSFESSNVEAAKKKLKVDEICATSMIVVITKSDLVTSLPAQKSEQLLLQFREFCVQQGAALIYTSSKNATNIALLTKYLIHRAYGLPFGEPAQFVHNDSIFVPAGWDNSQNINKIKDALANTKIRSSPERSSRDNAPSVVEPDVTAMDTQDFFEKMWELLEESQSVEPIAPSQKKIENKCCIDNVPLSNFFSNLLKGKSGVADENTSL